jgi:hypothetical protein
VRSRPPVGRGVAQKDHLSSPQVPLFRDRPLGHCCFSPIDRDFVFAFSPLRVLGAEHTRAGFGHPSGSPRTLEPSPSPEAWSEDDTARKDTVEAAGNRPALC